MEDKKMHSYARDTSAPASPGREEEDVHQQQRSDEGPDASAQGEGVREHVDRGREGDVRRKIPSESEELWDDLTIPGPENSFRLCPVLLPLKEGRELQAVVEENPTATSSTKASAAAGRSDSAELVRGGDQEEGGEG